MSIRKDSFYLIYLTEQQSVPITRYSPFAANKSTQDGKHRCQETVCVLAGSIIVCIADEFSLKGCEQHSQWPALSLMRF